MAPTDYQQNSLAPATPQASTKKKSLRLLIGLTVATLILLAAIGTGIYFLVKHNRAIAQEQEAYEALQQSSSSKDYSDFLARFPESGHKAEVQQRYEELAQVEAAWMKIRQSSNIAHFRRFSQTCQEPFYLSLCEQKIDSLEWVSAQAENTIEAYQNYTSAHPAGLYIADASYLLDKLKKAELTAEEQESVKSVLHNFFHYLGNNNQPAIATTIPPVMTQFLNKKNATKADVMNLVDHMFSDHIYQSRFYINDDYVITREAADTPTPYFKASFSVDQYITRDDEGKTFGSYQVVAEIDYNMKVRALTMKEVSRR
ncbi:MAG: hypothetical protein IJ816_01930 [Alloprevotella sp.]|nr:hypothetical protein [Alloprevotella sp.]